MALFAGNLLPASFRGAPFAVVADDIGGGRRIALHQYPGRDAPWAEDMGRAARTFRFRGFIVDGDVVFAGGPIQLQRALLLAALEASGAALLTHPTLGALKVCVTRFSLGQDLGASRMSSVDIEFVEAGSQTFPSLLSQASGILSASNLVLAGLALDGVRAIAIASATGAPRSDLTTAAALYSSQVVGLGTDATALHRLVAQLPGQLGRYAGGGNAGLTGSTSTTLTASTTVAELSTTASAERAAIGAAARALAVSIDAAALAYASDLSSAVTALVAALTAACADPADTLRLLIALVRYQPPRTSTALGLAFGRMVVRAAAAALTTAAGAYEPSSSDDAAAKIALLGGLLDDLATDAADAGEDASFKALRGARGAIVTDLRRRGGTLAGVKTFKVGASLPALALAQRFYRDPSRADQLVTQVPSAPHPLFMPAQIQALAA